MFKNFFDFLKGKDSLSQEMELFGKMLTNAEIMFKIACKRLLEVEPIAAEEAHESIYKTDKKINKAERSIRRLILEHLAIQPSIDLPSSLILMSVVKDAERVGDYAKNLFEVRDLLKTPLTSQQFRDYFDQLDQKVTIQFQKTKEAFLGSKTDIANQVMDIEREVVKACDAGIKKLAQREVKTAEAVSVTLVYRYFKRISAHLGNVATAVIMPLSDLDYFDESRRGKKA